ncbi:Abi family protein [Corynebacterium diphtheriae]|nr:Abi family protein [Corynebacterium diphtheriae]CAB0689117.1 Abi family protein [Corynebacterium diphtheriae]CAB0706882.1 Abi family protein [Corynebacterium diphtheriae]CAB0707134.1 Abi family protein [Corynebacterium diphtheriae]CAB0757730.1 Abi family protein [Corynebacterium diphtheriae]CAB0776048.1 Abi family protein [Corynebacterium diphtheriae]
MVEKYNKPHLTFGDQAAQLQLRGLIINNPDDCIGALEKIGYYRLSAYWYPFRKKKPKASRTTPFNYRLDEFEPKHTFEEAVALYRFDESLRRLLLEALGVIEIQLRTKIAYFAGKQDRFIHLKRELLDPIACCRVPKNSTQDSYQIWPHKYHKQIKRADWEDFIRHYQARYGKDIPIWIATEILDFGGVSKLFDFLSKQLKNQIALSFGAKEGTVVAGWIRNFNYIRNVSAHHSRLWNRLVITRIQAPNRNVVDPGIFHLADVKNRKSH